MRAFDDWLMSFLDSPWNVLGAAGALLAALLAVIFADAWLFYLRMITKSLLRNVVRTLLTSGATVVMVLVVTLIWTVVDGLQQRTTEKANDFKAIVTDRWQVPSQMPPSYVRSLSEGAAKKEDDARPDDSMTWTFLLGTTDGQKMTRENFVFFFAMEPGKVMRVERDSEGKPIKDRRGRIKSYSMMDVEDLTDDQRDKLDQAVTEMEKDPTKVLIGSKRLKALNKKVNERVTVGLVNYPGLTMEVTILGEMPGSRYEELGLLNRDYVIRQMDAYKAKTGKAHPMADKCVNLVWLKVKDTDTFRKVADQVMDSPEFKKPPVKVETEASGVASFLDAYRSWLAMFRFVVVPAILITMAVVIANAISISVRERRTEMAVLKVLGFGPTQIMILVLGEALLVGVLSGGVSSIFTYWALNSTGGLKFPVAFIGVFFVPDGALWWGAAIGGLTALAGSIVPAWSARSVKVAEVFSKLA